jgi:hypothetical protein
MARLSSWRLFGFYIALKKSIIHSDSETGCEPYVGSYTILVNDELIQKRVVLL